MSDQATDTTLRPDLNIVRVTKDNYQDYISDAAKLFLAYIIHYKWDHTLEMCHEFLIKRLNTGSQIFLCYYTPRNDQNDEKSAETGESSTKTTIPVGFCQLYPTWSSIAMEENWLLNDLYIDADYRSLKIGQSFIKHVIAFGDDSGAFKMFIDTTVNNPRAQYLYPKMGFVEYVRYDDTISYYYKYPRAIGKPYKSYYE